MERYGLDPYRIIIEDADADFALTIDIGDVQKTVALGPAAFAVFTDVHAIYTHTDDSIHPFRCRLVTISDDNDDAIEPFGTVQGALFCEDFNPY